MAKQSLKIFIEEKFDPGIKSALFSNFARTVDAIKEITDNSVSHRIPGKKLKIKINFLKNKLSVFDRGGTGMTLKDLEYFFKWGAPKERTTYDIGVFGQGGKSAIGYLGSSMMIETSPVGEKIAFYLEDNNLRDITKFKKYCIKQLPSKTKEGYTRIEIGGLKSHLREKEIKRELIDTYRPLLEKGAISIRFNKENLKPLPFLLDSGFKIQKFSFSILAGKKISGWIGRLNPQSGLRGGIRCYHKGRLILREEFFGHPDFHYKGSLNLLFGEIYLDQVPVVMNKTDFLRNSKEWIEVQKKMFQILKPHIQELLAVEIVEPSEEEVKRVQETRKIFYRILRKIKREEELALKGGVPVERQRGGFSLSKIKKGKKKIRPLTDLLLDRKKKVDEFDRWKIRPMDELTRSIIEGKGKKKTLVINNLFPGYLANKGNKLYLMETASLQVAKPLEETLKPEEYLKTFDELFARICKHLEEKKKPLIKVS